MDSKQSITVVIIPDDVMEEICKAAQEAWQEGVVLTWKALGVDLQDPDCPEIDPSEYQIPYEQWCQIAEACGTDRTGHNPPVRSVNHMLDWMNYGPSSFGSSI